MNFFLSSLVTLLLASSASLNLPERVELIFGKENRILSCDDVAEHVIFLYRNPEACTPCSIKEILPLEGLYKLVHRCSNIALFVLFSPSQESYAELRSMLLSEALKFPVYIDVSFCFEELNPVIKYDQDLHHCILDANRAIVLTGDPLSSDEAWMKYVSFIEQNGVTSR